MEKLLEKIKSVKFGKPDFKDLIRRGYMLVDMHVHTNVSDGTCSARAILEKAKSLGIGVAISDHEKSEAAVKYFNNDYGVNVIPSMEVEAETGEHFLYYFKDPDELKRFHISEIRGKECKRSISELLNIKQSYDCMVSWAHPAGWTSWHKKHITFNLHKIDCLELFNGHAGRQNISKVAAWILKYGKPFTGGSDVHELSQLGRVVTCAKAANISEFLDKVRKRRVKIIGDRVDLKSFILKYPFKIAFAKMNYLFKI